MPLLIKRLHGNRISVQITINSMFVTESLVQQLGTCSSFIDGVLEKLVLSMLCADPVHDPERVLIFENNVHTISWCSLQLDDLALVIVLQHELTTD